MKNEKTRIAVKNNSKTEEAIIMKNAKAKIAVKNNSKTEGAIIMKNAKARIAVKNNSKTEEAIAMKKRSVCGKSAGIAGNAGNTVKHVYEASVKARAIARAGNCNNLNGHILEVMGADKTNLNPFNGLKETLTRSRTATSVDSIVTRGGRIVQRVQYKDTAKSIGDTIRRVKDGQYQSVTLKGTSETAKVFNKVAEKQGIAKRMQDSGISSNTTKSLARSCGAAKQVSLARAAGMAAKSGGIVGGAVSGGISLISNTIAVANGEKEVGEAVGCIAKDTAGGVLSGAGSAAAATVTGAAVASAVAGTAIAGTAIGTACVVAAPVAVAIGVGCAITAVWNAIWD